MSSTDAFSHLDSASHERIAHILCQQVPEVFRLNRIIEQKTGYKSVIGGHMLVDVLAHLGTLASRSDLSPEQQATQLSKIEEHLRRAIIEHPEEVVRNRLVDVRTLWGEYEREAYTYRQQGLLRGVPLHTELQEDRTRIDALMEAARRSKPDETTWEESLDAAAAMTKAADVARGLANKLDACIGAAQRLTQEGRRDTTATKRDRKATGLAILGILLAVGLFFTGLAIGDGSSSHAHSKTVYVNSRTP